MEKGGFGCCCLTTLKAQITACQFVIFIRLTCFHYLAQVFPGSFGINSTLGNLRVCDMTLGADHQWGWMCDIRDPGCDSLVKVWFGNVLCPYNLIFNLLNLMM